jgi:hypothetical protein
LRQQAWFDVGEDRLFFDMLQVLGQQVHYSVANFTKFSGIHWVRLMIGIKAILPRQHFLKRIS